MKKSGKVIITAVVVIGAAALILPRFLKPKEQVVAASLPVVTIQNPEMGDIKLTTALIGSVEPSDIVYVIPKAAGEVKEVYAKAGDTVKEGQQLCYIDTKQVDAAKISLDTTAVNMQDAKNSLDRMSVLFASGDISKQTYEQTESGYNLAKLQYESAKLNYDNQVEFSSITAPISGIVESFNVEVHDNVSQQNTICVISGEGTKAVSFNVSERVVKGLSVGDTITVEKNGSEYQGTISEVSTMVDPATGLFKVKASMENADALATGSQVKLYVVSERADHVMMIPTDAVYYEGGQPKVYLYEDGAVREREIEIGIYDSKQTEVVSGLKPEEQVIVTWSSELFDGSQVEVYTDNAAASAAESTDGEENSTGSGNSADGQDTTQAAE